LALIRFLVLTLHCLLSSCTYTLPWSLFHGILSWFYTIITNSFLSSPNLELFRKDYLPEEYPSSYLPITLTDTSKVFIYEQHPEREGIPNNYKGTVIWERERERERERESEPESARERESEISLPVQFMVVLSVISIT
jgi:hypothetical protein